jgi:hypothetical protein
MYMKPDKPIPIIRGIGVDENIINMSNAIMIVQKYGSAFEMINHNNFSIEMKYPEIGLSFSYKFNDKYQEIYVISVFHPCVAVTENGMIFNHDLKLKDVIDKYYQGNFYEINTEVTQMHLDGLFFEMNKSELFSSDISPLEASINKIMVL